MIKKGILMSFFSVLRYDPDLEWEFIDASIVKAHQHSTGARTEDDEGIGKVLRVTPLKFIWR